MTIRKTTLFAVSALAWLPLCSTLILAQPAQDATDQQKSSNDPTTLAEQIDGATANTNANETASVREESSDAAPLVVIGRDAELPAGQTAETVVVIGGSARIHGKVREAVVAIGGDVMVDGEVGEAVVAVLGNIDAKAGARIHGDAVAVGGKLNVSPGAKVTRTQQAVELPDLRWIRNWFIHCALLLRPLSFQVGGVWLIAGAFFLLYLLVAAVFPRPVEVCANELFRRPATSFLVGLLTILLIPFLVLLLAVTGVGVIVLPFVFAAVFIATIVGKVGLLEWIGLKIGRQSDNETLHKPLVALVVGTVVVLLLYLVPVLGLATFALTRVWGLGAAVLAGFSGLRREIPEKPAAPITPMPEPPPTSPAPTPGPMPLGVAALGSQPVGGDAPLTQSVPASESPKPENPAPQPGLPPSIPVLPPAVPEILTHPHAGFWERMGAGFLDVVLICVLAAWVGPFAPVVALAYFAGMWAWKQTTIGGIVLGLKVARLDGGSISFAVALVRALAAGFSIFVLFLGFLWIAWDRDKQGWHDKIAGTVVLKLPRGTPLVCL